MTRVLYKFDLFPELPPNVSKQIWKVRKYWIRTIGVGAGKFLGVRKIFARISQKLARNLVSISSHTDRFWDNLPKKGLRVILPTLGANFAKSNNVGRHIYPYFQVACPECQVFCEHFHRFCPDFHRFFPDSQGFAKPVTSLGHHVGWRVF